MTEQPEARPEESPPPARLLAIQTELREVFGQFDSLHEQPELAARAEAIAAGNDRLTPVQQAEVYREQYWLRHRDALYDDYPGLEYMLGEEAFETFVRAYLEAYPPSSWTLRDLGWKVGEFAATYDGFPEGKETMLAELARFENAFPDIFDGPAAAPVPPERLAELAPEDWNRARIVLHPLLKLMRFRYPVIRIRTGLSEGGEPDQDLPEKALFVAMHRGHDLKVHYRPLDQPAFELLEAMAAGQSLVAACEAVAATIPEDEQAGFAGRLQTWFRLWAERGWIVDVIVD